MFNRKNVFKMIVIHISQELRALSRAHVLLNPSSCRMG